MPQLVGRPITRKDLLEKLDAVSQAADYLRNMISSSKRDWIPKTDSPEVLAYNRAVTGFWSFFSRLRKQKKFAA